MFVLQRLSLHWEILIILLSQFPFDIPSYSQWNSLFHRIVYDYCRADWDDLLDYLREFPWKEIFKLSASAAAEFYEWIPVGIDVYIPHRKNQVKSHSSPWFSAACASAIVHINHFFRLYQQDKFSESKKNQAA